MPDRNVRPNGLPVTEQDFREMLAISLRRVCSEYGPTRVGAVIGCDEKTVRNGRDELHTISPHTAVNLLALDEMALEPILNRFGRRSVPISTDLATLEAARDVIDGVISKLRGAA